MKLMSHEIYTIEAFEVVAPYTLRLTFNDGSVKVIDLLPMLRGELLAPLRDPGLFAQARLDPESGTLVWPNHADFDPAILHDWDSVGNAMIQMASSWSESEYGSGAMTEERKR